MKLKLKKLSRIYMTLNDGDSVHIGLSMKDEIDIEES